MLTRADYVNWLYERPMEYGHQMGFTLLTELHNGLIRSMICQGPDHTLMAHRGSYKTTCVSIAFAIMMITRPNDRIMFVRKTDTDVKEVIEQVEHMLLNEKTQYLVKQMYGTSLTLVVNSSTELKTNLTNDPRGTSQLLGIGIGGSLTGKHYDYIFTDDIINMKDRSSRAERERTKDAYRELQNIKNRGGRIFNTLTPWHVDDAAMLMPEPERWPWDKTGLMTKEQYDEIAKVTTPSLLAANYQLRHIPSDDVIFTDPKTGASHEKVYHGICHVDAAYGGEDYTAFTAMRYEEGTYYVYGRVWRKHVSDVADLIKADHTRLMLGKLHIETNGDKGFMARDFKQMGIPVVPYNETMNKILKIETYLKQAWPSIVFVDGTDQEFINQICDWTEEAEHDDCPDSAASLCRVLSARIRNEGYKSRLY
jgi:hypothetical protein